MLLKLQKYEVDVMVNSSMIWMWRDFRVRRKRHVCGFKVKNNDPHDLNSSACDLSGLNFVFFQLCYDWTGLKPEGLNSPSFTFSHLLTDQGADVGTIVMMTSKKEKGTF